MVPYKDFYIRSTEVMGGGWQKGRKEPRAPPVLGDQAFAEGRQETQGRPPALLERWLSTAKCPTTAQAATGCKDRPSLGPAHRQAQEQRQLFCLLGFSVTKRAAGTRSETVQPPDTALPQLSTKSQRQLTDKRASVLQITTYLGGGWMGPS